MKNSNEIIDFTFEILGTGLFDSVTVPPKDGASYTKLDIHKLAAIESSLRN